MIDLIQIHECFNVSFNIFSLTLIDGYDNMILVYNSNAYFFSGIFKNCSSHNYTIFLVDNSSFSLENMEFYDFYSLLIYSSLGFIRFDNCIFNNLNNLNSNNLENEMAIKLEQHVSFIIRNSQFKNLYNFAKVIIFNPTNLKLFYRWCI